MSSLGGQEAAACAGPWLPCAVGRERWQMAEAGPCGASTCPGPSAWELPPNPTGAPAQLRGHEAMRGLQYLLLAMGWALV